MIRIIVTQVKHAHKLDSKLGHVVKYELVGPKGHQQDNLCFGQPLSSTLVSHPDTILSSSKSRGKTKKKKKPTQSLCIYKWEKIPLGLHEEETASSFHHISTNPKVEKN